MKKTPIAKQTVYDRVQLIRASAKDYAAHSVNTAQVVANWLLGREIESIQKNWRGRELERQIASLLFERLATSRDKAGVMKLATKEQEIAAPKLRKEG